MTTAPQLASDPTSIGAFTVLERLSVHEGAVDYLCTSEDGERVVATIVRPDLVAGPARSAAAADVAARARAAVDVAAATTGVPGLVRLFAADPDGDPPWLATERVEGRPLLGAAAHVGLAPAQVPGLAAELAGCLADVHATGYALRTVTPEHVVLAPGGARLAELGLARRQGTPTEFQSGRAPEWSPPEMLDPLRDPRPRDIHGWGMVVAYAATGRPAFGVGSRPEVAERMRGSRPDIGGLPEPLRGLVSAALAPSPGDRPTAAALAAALGEGPAARTLPVGASPLRRRRSAAAVAVLAVLAAGGAVVVRGLAEGGEGTIAGPSGGPAAPEGPASAPTAAGRTSGAAPTPAPEATSPLPPAETRGASPVAARTTLAAAADAAVGSGPSQPAAAPASSTSSPGTGSGAAAPTPVPSDLPTPSGAPSTPSAPTPTPTTAPSTPSPTPTATKPGKGHGHGHDKPPKDRLRDGVVRVVEDLTLP